MVRLDPMMTQRTVAAVFEVYENTNDDWRREHLGASLIGRECSRHLWYGFRWASETKFEGRMLRLFERGQREEEWLARDLRAAGVNLVTIDPDTGEQWRVEIFPHFGGSSDGRGFGFLEAPKTEHLWECKTSNDKGFKKLQREGVRKAKPEHYAQMQVYMHGLGITRASYWCVNKNDDTIYNERVYYDREFAEALVSKAKLIVSAPEPLTKISEDPTWFACKWCDHRPICQLGQVEKLERNCRTCASSTPLPDGTWRCDLYQKPLDAGAQRAGCPSHLFIPAMLPWEVAGVDERARRITYRRRDGGTVTDTGDDLVVKP